MRVILRVRGNPEAYVESLEQMGVQVIRVFRVIPALLVEIPEEMIPRLAREPWVERVEPDRPVQTFGEEAS